MPDPTAPALPVPPSAEPHGEVLAPVEGSEAMKKMTHEVNADDMFESSD